MANTQQYIYENLRDALREQRIKPDTRLNISETAEEHGGSIIPTREAIARLAAEGLLERVPSGGFKAPGLSVANVEGDFTVVFLCLRHVNDIYFANEELARTILDHVVRQNAMLPDLRGDAHGITDEAEQYVRGLLPVVNSSKFRSCVEAALDASWIYRLVYYRETLQFDVYLQVRAAYEVALRMGDQATAKELILVSQRDWEGKTRDLCRYAWTELFEK